VPAPVLTPAEQRRFDRYLNRNRLPAVYDGPTAEPPHQYTHLPFGKYRGWSVQNIPDDYLAWLQTQNLSRAVHATVEAEVARRRPIHPDLDAWSAAAWAELDGLVNDR